MKTQQITTQCCIAGGGPAGIMLGFLLARAGIDTIVLEKWPDFFRDFRGDTIHPSTMEILDALGLLDKFLALPHNKMYQLEADIGNEKLIMEDFSRLRVKCPFIAFIPQWDFLNFIAGEAKQYPHFHLMMQTAVTDLLREDNYVIGVRAKDKTLTYEIHADLVVGADGRHSIIREKSGLPMKIHGSPIDVLWFKLSRLPSDPAQTLGKINKGKMLVLMDRGDFWQCAYIVRKNQVERLKEAGLSAFQDRLAEIVPFMRDRLGEIVSWDQVKLLQVRVDGLTTWYQKGLLCIGDAAHAMSPMGGVGINLAIQDAVASANRLIPAFLQGKPDESILRAIQSRRKWPARVTQRFQALIQKRVIDRVLDDSVQTRLPFMLKCLKRFPFFKHVTGYLIGIGIRPEKVIPISPAGASFGQHC